MGQKSAGGTFDHLNTMLERSVIDLFCTKLGLVRKVFVDGTDAPWAGSCLGQSLAVISKT